MTLNIYLKTMILFDLMDYRLQYCNCSVRSVRVRKNSYHLFTGTGRKSDFCGPKSLLLNKAKPSLTKGLRGHKNHCFNSEVIYSKQVFCYKVYVSKYE